MSSESPFPIVDQTIRELAIRARNLGPGAHAVVDVDDLRVLVTVWRDGVLIASATA